MGANFLYIARSVHKSSHRNIFAIFDCIFFLQYFIIIKCCRARGSVFAAGAGSKEAFHCWQFFLFVLKHLLINAYINNYYQHIKHFNKCLIGFQRRKLSLLTFFLFVLKHFWSTINIYIHNYYQHIKHITITKCLIGFQRRKLSLLTINCLRISSFFRSATQ